MADQDQNKAANRRGQRKGYPMREAIEKSIAVKKADALKFALGIADEVLKLRAEGHSLTRMAKLMNERGIPTRKNTQWHAASVKKLLALLDEHSAKGSE